MLEWLLKDENNKKNKVGRPKLADAIQLKKAEIMVFCCMLVSFIMVFCFISILQGKSPITYAYDLTSKKLSAKLPNLIQNKNGFKVNNYYKDNNFVVRVNIPSVISNYSGNYKYTLYKLKNGSWKEIDSNEYENSVKKFNVTIKRNSNENTTYKLKLSLVNASQVDKSFAPSGWEYVPSKKGENYAFKIFTVKGYYSPIDNKELKEGKKNPDKISITTDNLNPRIFIINNMNLIYDMKVSYTDDNGKLVSLKKKDDLIKEEKIIVPSFKRISKVTFKIWIKDIEYSKLKDYKMSNWEIEKDKDGNYYLEAKYILKPTGSY